jgi:putative transposase
VSINRQCELLCVPRASYYYLPKSETEYNLMLMREIDKQYLESPTYGSRLMTACLKLNGHQVNRKRVSRLMQQMGIETIYQRPKRKTTEPGLIKFPYLLKELNFENQNHVWGTDITYIPMDSGFLYLVAYIDLYSRYVVSWQLSNSLDSKFCIEALERALKYSKPKILNSDQGIQYTSKDYINSLTNQGVKISMSGKGRCWDNIFVERFWRSLKYEEVYLKQYGSSLEAFAELSAYIKHYNYKRPHSSLNYKTPAQVYNSA